MMKRHSGTAFGRVGPVRRTAATDAALPFGFLGAVGFGTCPGHFTAPVAQKLVMTERRNTAAVQKCSGRVFGNRVRAVRNCRFHI